jgi:ABC-type sugar transport system ATPase subunit
VSVARDREQTMSKPDAKIETGVSPAPAADTPAGDGQPLLRLAGIEKRFGGVHALRGADLTISSAGVVHTIAGENGSGKSTLLGVLSGQIRPDAGAISLSGRDTSFHSPNDALRAGIAIVSQETAVAPDLTVAENVLMGRRMVRGSLGLNLAATRRRAAAVLARLGLDYDPRGLVGELRPDQRQMVEIARAVSQEARILILDEPTSLLTEDEVAGLLEAIRQLQAQDVAIVFVSHRLPEVFAISDEVTVLRDGATVAAGPVASFYSHSLVEAMVGDTPRGTSPPQLDRVDAERGVLLEVRGLSRDGALRDIDLEVREGEIVGLAGLVGAGRSELLEAIFGLLPTEAGEIRLGGERLAVRSPRQAVAKGLGFLPPNRDVQGLVLGMSSIANLTMVETHRRFRLGRPNRAREDASFAAAVTGMRLRGAYPDGAVKNLSGGNQQKIALAKWLPTAPRLLLLDEPTRGVDVAAKADIHERLREVAAGGVGILVSSSESPELLELCDRIVVMFGGRVTASLTHNEASEKELARLAGGHQ